MEFVILLFAITAFLFIAFKAVKELYGNFAGKKPFDYLYYALVSVLFTCFVLAAAGVSFVENISGVLVTLSLSAGLIIAFVKLLRVYGKERSGGFNKTALFIIKAFIVTILVEVFLFNLSSMHLLGKKASASEIPLSAADMTGMFFDGENYVSISSNSTVLITDINHPVYTLRFDLQPDNNTSLVAADVGFSDSTFKAIRCKTAAVSVLWGIENSGYMQCEFSGNVGALKISFRINDGEYFILKGITANEKIPFQFSFARVFVFLLAAISAYLFLSNIKLKKPLGQSKEYKSVIYLSTALFMMLAIFLIVLRQGVSFQSFLSADGNQITKELVDAFKQGNYFLNDAVPDELLELENPYDYSQRYLNGIDYKWDHLLYNGKYYSYYGIAPVLLLFLPYNLLTGYYFPTEIAVLLFSLIGIWFLTKTYVALTERRFPKLQSNMAIMGLLIIQLISGIFYCVSRPLFYEISISAGFAFVCLGAFFLITSNIIGGGKISCSRIMLSSVFFSLGVLSRPTTAVYSVAALAFIAFGFFELRKERKNHFKLLFFALVPFAVFGLIQMGYNYIRFGSPLDFGIQYSLTINDFINAQFHTKFVFISLFAFLFAAPYFVPKFPYVSSEFQLLSTNGFFFVDNMDIDALAIGIFFKALPVWSYFAINRAYRLMPEKTRRRDMLLLILFCVISPLVVICSIWESGYAVRYAADIYWQFVLGALCIIFIMFSNKSHRGKRYFEVFMLVSLLLAAVVCFAQIYNFCYIIGGTNRWLYLANLIRYTFEVFK